MSDTATESPAVEVEKPAKAVKVATPCACQFYSGKDAKGEELSTGCSEETVRTFRPGHDAKLKSLLIKVATAGNQVTKSTDDADVEMDPLHAAEEFGFRGLVEKSVENARSKENARAAKAQERADKKAAADKAKADAKAEREEAARVKKERAARLAEATKKANEEKPVGPATAKVGREKYDGEVVEGGKFRYLNGNGETVETDKFVIVIDPATVDAN